MNNLKILAAIFFLLWASEGWSNEKYTDITGYASYKEGSDWAPAFKKAFAECNRIYVPPGHYPCSEVKIPGNTSLCGAGNGTVFIPLSSHLFIIEGEIGEEIKVVADIQDFSNTILLEETAGLKVGDEILIQGQRNSMLREGIAGVNYNPDWVLGRTRKSSCFFGEMDVVSSVKGGEITTGKHRLFPNYYKDDSREPQGIGKGFLFREATTVSKLSMAKGVSLRNFSISGTAQCYMPIKLYYAKDCLVENITFSTSTVSYKPNGKEDLSILYGLYAWNTVVRNFKAILSPGLLTRLDAKEKAYKDFSNYNLFKMISSTNSGFENCYANGGCHAFNITRSAAPKGRGGIPSANCFTRNCTVSNCLWSGVTVQQGCYNTELSGNTVTASGQGIITGGRNTTIVNNIVDTNMPYSTDYYYTQIYRGGTVGIGLIEGAACGSIVRNNIISNFYTGIGFIDGYEKKNCFEEGNITIENNTVSGCQRGFSLYKNDHCTALGNNDLNINIRNNSFTGYACGIYLPEASAGINIQNNTFAHFAQGICKDKSTGPITEENNTFTD